jgi:predicted HicB family RNase H-like nuclease
MIGVLSKLVEVLLTAIADAKTVKSLNIEALEANFERFSGGFEDLKSRTNFDSKEFERIQSAGMAVITDLVVTQDRFFSNSPNHFEGKLKKLENGPLAKYIDKEAKSIFEGSLAGLRAAIESDEKGKVTRLREAYLECEKDLESLLEKAQRRQNRARKEMEAKSKRAVKKIAEAEVEIMGLIDQL